MRTKIKIILLAFLVIASIVSVVVAAEQLQKPVAVPEMKPDYAGYYKEKLDNYKKESSDNIFRDLKTILSLDSIMTAEEMIKSQNHDEIMGEIYDAFAPRFNKWAFQKFDQDVWKSADIATMRKYASKIMNAPSVSMRSSALASKVSDVVDDYDKAYAFCNEYHYYENNDQTKEVIGKANDFLSKSPLNKNTRLCESLKDVKQDICNSHYNKVMAEIDEVANCYSQSDLERLLDRKAMTVSELKTAINNHLSEYKSMEQNYYHLLSTDKSHETLEGRWNIARQNNGI